MPQRRGAVRELVRLLIEDIVVGYVNPLLFGQHASHQLLESPVEVTAAVIGKDHSAFFQQEPSQRFYISRADRDVALSGQVHKGRCPVLGEMFQVANPDRFGTGGNFEPG